MTLAAAGGATLTVQVPRTLQSMLTDGSLKSYQGGSDFAACLMPLLEALKWWGNPGDIAEAMPHFVETLDLVGLRNTLARLGFVTRKRRIPLHRIDPRLMPCLYVADRGGAKALLATTADGVTLYDGETGARTTLGNRRITGTAYFISRPDPASPDQRIEMREHWFSTVAARFRQIVTQALVLSLFLDLMTLGAPLFVMEVYDQVIATGSRVTLAYLALGMVILIVFNAALRAVRVRMLAYIGARIDVIVGAGTFEKLLCLPTSQTEGVTVGIQLARLKQFETVRDFFTGPLALVCLALPSVPVFLLVIAILGGPLAIIPVVMVALFAIAAALIFPRMRRRVRDSSRATAERQGFLVEMLAGMRDIKTGGSDAVWRERLRVVSAKAAVSGFRVGQLANLVQTIAYVFMLTAGIATLAFGILRVLDGVMSVGALVAVMALVWRVLSPLQTGYMALSKLEQIVAGVRQINALMRLSGEPATSALVATRKHFRGRVTFARVSLRYRSEGEPALVGVTFDVKPGQIVGIVGPNGSGKSSLLKLILGLYSPQAGGVLVDGLDVHQIDPASLRKSVAYVPQVTHIFYGTIAQNLRLADPAASDDALHQAAEKAAVLDDILALPEGFATRIRGQGARALPAGVLQRLALARAYLKQAPVLLFDEPANALDNKGDQAFIAQLERLRGRATVFVVTHRPSHMRVADRLLVLDRGVLRLDGSPEDVLKQLPDGFL